MKICSTSSADTSLKRRYVNIKRKFVAAASIDSDLHHSSVSFDFVWDTDYDISEVTQAVENAMDSCNVTFIGIDFYSVDYSNYPRYAHLNVSQCGADFEWSGDYDQAALPDAISDEMNALGYEVIGVSFDSIEASCDINCADSVDGTSTDECSVIKVSKWYDPEGLDVPADGIVQFTGSYQQCFDWLTEKSIDCEKHSETCIVEDYVPGEHLKVYYPYAISKVTFAIRDN